METLEIIGKDTKSFTKDEFTTFLAEQVCKFTNDAPEDTSAKSKFIIELTLAMFSAEITAELFGKEK